jgi:long-chain-fatty-acid--CoA ligase ACSBG
VFWTFNDLYAQSVSFAKAMIYLGIQPRKCTNIIGFNSPEWVLAFIGSSFADCVPVGIYTTNGSEACQYIVDHSEAELIVC